MIHGQCRPLRLEKVANNQRQPTDPAGRQGQCLHSAPGAPAQDVVTAPHAVCRAGVFAAGTSQPRRVRIIVSTWHLFIENFTHVSLSALLLTLWLNHHPPGSPSSVTAASCSLSTVWILSDGVSTVQADS